MAEQLDDHRVNVSDLYRIEGQGSSWEAVPLDVAELQEGGIPGDRHFGATRQFQVYEGGQELGKAVVHNDRALSVIDELDLRDIAYIMELPADLIEERLEMPMRDFLARMLAANVVLLGNIRTSEYVHPGVVMAFIGQDGLSSAIKIHEYNPPCSKPARMMLEAFRSHEIRYANDDFDEVKRQFKLAADKNRGWLASVYSVGGVTVGDRVLIRQPKTEYHTKLRTPFENHNPKKAAW